MSYEDEAELARNQAYLARCYACVRSKALEYIEDERPEYKALAEQVIQNPVSSASYNVSVMTASVEGMTVDSTDEDLDAAVDQVWPLVGKAYVDGTISTTMAPPGAFVP